MPRKICFFDKSASIEKLQADVEANNKLRTQEEAVMAADADTNQKQLIDSKKLVAKLESDAAATQKLLAKEKENVAKLQADTSETRKQLEQEKQTVAKVKAQAATTHQQLEQEREREVGEAQGRC